MYFDAVINDEMEPVFNGTPEETHEWIRKNYVMVKYFRVVIGATMQIVTVEEYMNKH